MRIRSVAWAGCGAGAVVLWVVLLAGVGAAQADENLEWDTTLTYRLDPDARSIALTSDITVTNRQPNGREGNTIIQYYFDRIGIYIPVEADGLVVTGSGKELDYEIQDPEDEGTAGVELLEIRLPRRLFYNRSTDVRVEYSIHGDDPRSDSMFRVNPAYASFGVWAWGDPGRIEVDVIVDDAYDVTATGSTYQVFREGSDVIYRMTDIDDPDQWFMFFTARNDAMLDTETVPLGDHDIVVRGWPGDAFWMDEIEATVTEGTPTLEELVGLDWQVDHDLTVSESIEPNLLGYGGWYIDESEAVEIGEFVDTHLVLHEIGHTWFNEDLFEERWINEGLADTFAAAAVDELDETSLYTLETPTRNGPYSFPLEEWTDPVDFDQKEERREEYAYTTAWWVIDRLSQEIGIDGLRAVIGAADADQIAYQGEGPAETVDPSDDWRRFLDLLEEVGHSENASALFSEWILGGGGDLTTRTETRASYAALVASADGWSIPFTVRTEMSSWDFPAAEDAIADAERVIEVRESIETNAASLGAQPPSSLEDAFESATGDLVAAQDLADRQQETTEGLVAAQERVRTDRGVLEFIGLIGEHPDEDLADAIAAFEQDDLDGANGAAAALTQLMNDAGSVGTTRVVIAAVVLALLLSVASGAVIWVRRRRRGTVSEPTTPDVAVDDAGDTFDDALLIPRERPSTSDPDGDPHS